VGVGVGGGGAVAVAACRSEKSSTRSGPLAQETPTTPIADAIANAYAGSVRCIVEEYRNRKVEGNRRR
jgi:hypothetical protein